MLDRTGIGYYKRERAAEGEFELAVQVFVPVGPFACIFAFDAKGRLIRMNGKREGRS
jgi:hypothetical protein